MVWSVSASRTWSRCQRQLFFDLIMGSAVAKDEMRRRAQFLGGMQHISWWPGRIVHDVIERSVLPEVRSGRWPDTSSVLASAAALAERQFQFSATQRFRSVAKRDAPEDYLVLAQHYYDESLSPDTLGNVISRVSNALTGLLKSVGLKQFLLGRQWYGWEQAIHFKIEDRSVRAVPDLVMPSKTGLGLDVVDWKVAASGSNYRFQVGVYALAALENDKLGAYARRGVRAYVINLLLQDPSTALEDPFIPTDDDLSATTDAIFESMQSIQMVTHGEKYENLDIARFEYARSVGTCATCNWRELCVEIGDDSPAKSLPDIESGPAQLALPLG